MEKPALGFIGLGKMGAPMAMRFVDAGYPLCVFDPRPDAMLPFAVRGARPARSPADVAAQASIVLLCLPTPDVVRAVALGSGDPAGATPADAPGIVHGGAARILIDLGTTGPAMARTVAAGTAPHGVTFVDSPVTGGIAGAIAGSLAVMVSCPAATFTTVEPILQHLGRVFYTGAAAGLAQTAKLANNLLSAAALAVSSEAMAMGVKAGIDPQILLDIINAGSGRNSATEDKFPRAILPRTFDFGMSTGLFLKDVRLALDEADSLGVPTVVGAAVRQMFTITRARFGAASDFTCIAKVIEEWAGTAMRGSEK